MKQICMALLLYAGAMVSGCGQLPPEYLEYAKQKSAEIGIKDATVMITQYEIARALIDRAKKTEDDKEFERLIDRAREMLRGDLK